MIQKLLVDWRLFLILVHFRACFQFERSLVFGLVQRRVFDITVALLNLVTEFIFFFAGYVVSLNFIQTLQATFHNDLLALIIIEILLRLLKLRNQNLTLRMHLIGSVEILVPRDVTQVTGVQVISLV